jgi:biopolymer transport protein ExbB/TolQ
MKGLGYSMILGIVMIWILLSLRIIFLISYQTATSSSEDRRFLRKMGFASLILDEGHMIKNDSSQRSKHLTGILY